MPIDNSTFEALTMLNLKNLNSKVDFKDGELKRVLDDLTSNTTFSSESDDTDETILSGIVSDIQYNMQNPEGVNYKDVIYNLALSISGEVSTAFKTLKGPIFDMVDSLSKDIRQYSDKYLRTNGSEVLASNTEPDVEFGIFNWGQLKNTNYKDNVITTACSYAELSKHELNKNYINRMSGVVADSKIIDIELNPELTESLVETIDKIVTTEETDVVRDKLKLLLSSGSFKVFKNNVYKYLKNNNAVVGDMAKMKGEVDTIKSILRGLDNVSLNLNEDTISNINANKVALNGVLSIIEYSLLVARNIYSDTFVMSPTMLNSDNYNDFIKAGGTIKDVAYHLRTLYNINNPVDSKPRKFPTFGIPMQNIINSKASVNAKVEEQNISIKLSKKAIKAKADKFAYKRTLDNYLRDLPATTIPKNVPASDFYKNNRHMIDKSFRGYDPERDNIEDRLYVFVIDTFYKDKLVETIYSYFGNEYKKLMQRKDAKIEEKDLVDINAKVVAILVCEYLEKSQLRA